MTLTTLWDMSELRSAIISKLSTEGGGLDTAQRINFALKFSITGWVPQAVSKLVCRSTRPSAQEMELLGFDMAAMVWSLREKNRAEAVHHTRTEVHNRLFDCSAGDNSFLMSCSCSTCRYAREITLSGKFRSTLIEVSYFAVMPGVENEIAETEISNGTG
jgi:hypothetical protein